jgi:hypothetical protein
VVEDDRFLVGGEDGRNQEDSGLVGLVADRVHDIVIEEECIPLGHDDLVIVNGFADTP